MICFFIDEGKNKRGTGERKGSSEEGKKGWKEKKKKGRKGGRERGM